MNKRYKELISNTGLLTISNFSSKILVLLLVPIYTNALSTSDYGFYDLTYTSIQLLYPIFTLGIAEGMTRFLLEGKHDEYSIISSGLNVTMVGVVIFILLLIDSSFLYYSIKLKDFSIYLIVYFFFYSIHSAQVQILKGLNRVKIIAISGILGTVSMLFSNIFFLLYMKSGLKGFYIANILGVGIPSIYIFFAIQQWNYLKLKNDRLLLKQLIVYSLPMVVNTIGWWANNSSDRYVVSLLCGVEINGLLSIAYKIPNIIHVIGAIFIQAWQISAVKEYQENKNSHFFKNLFWHFNAVICCLSAVLILSARIIARLFFANDFYPAWRFIPLLIISVFLNQASGFVGPILSAQMNTKAMGKSAMVGIVVNVILNIVLTLFFGPLGITVASVIGSFIIYYMRERSSGKILRSEKYKYILFSWGIMIIEAICMIFQIHIVFVFLIACSVGYIYKNTIKIVLLKLLYVVQSLYNRLFSN